MWDRAKFKKEAIDQSLHAGAAVLLLACVASGTIIGWAFAAFGMGYIRELTEGEFQRIEGRKITPAVMLDAAWQSKLDLAGWTLGGVIAFLLFA